MLVRVSSLALAKELANGWADKVVSLVDASTELPKFDVPHLILRMADTEVATDLWAPQQSDIDRAFTFVGKDDRVLVHCEGGISRSVAMGLGFWVSDGVPVQDALIRVHADRPNMAPNKLILRLIDNHLKMDGKFISDVNAAVAHLPKDLWLWCDDCKIHFKDQDGHTCPDGKWLSQTK